jgi:conjugal transfer mating pair stabilization protein TraN
MNSTATCWRYQDDYSCIAENHIDYCAPSRRRKGALVSATCDSTAFDGSCNQYTRRYQCTNVTASTTPDGGRTQHVLHHHVQHAGYQSMRVVRHSANCVHAATTCTDSTPCKTINGLQVCLTTVSPLPSGAQSSGDSCWARTEDYTCAGAR